MTTEMNQQLVEGHESEHESLARLDALLRHATSAPSIQLIDAHGEKIALPESVATALRQLVHYLASDRAVTVVPINRVLTTQEAADILNVSRPYLIKLLEAGALPYSKVGTHRRIAFDDVMTYKQQRDAERRRVLDDLAALNEAMGLYDE